MYSSQIRVILKDVRAFGGVLAVDQLHTANKHKIYIVNTDPSNLPGKHWVGVSLGDVPEFFDSLGNPPGFYNKLFEDCLIHHGPSYLYNSQRLQSPGSDVCGEFCIQYVLYRAAGYSMSTFVKSFNRSNLYWNDRRVTHFCKRLNYLGKA